MYEGGLRVPGIIEWPAVIKKPRVTKYPAGTVDVFSTLAEVANLPPSSMLLPQDGTSLRPLFDAEIGSRKKPLAFRHRDRGVIIDNQFKLLSMGGKYELYDLNADKTESDNLIDKNPDVAQRLKKAYLSWNETVDAPYLKELLGKPTESKNPKPKKTKAGNQKNNKKKNSKNSSSR
jgi:arylsulfatase A-like enzyme